MAHLSFFADRMPPHLDSVLQLVMAFCGCTLNWSEPGEDPVDLYWGERTDVSCRQRIPLDEECDVAVCEANEDTPSRFGFDVVSAIHFWLSDKAHVRVGADALDVHFRLKPRASYQHQLGALTEPLVNKYLSRLREWLGTFATLEPCAYLSAGKRAVVVLSHDVDNPIDPGDVLRRSDTLLRTLKGLNKAKVVSSMADVGRSVATRIRRRQARHWVFEDVCREEEKRGFRSAWYFAPTPSTHSQGHKLDVQYQLNSPIFRAVFKRLQDTNHEVGLHIGYDAIKNPGQMRREMNALETLLRERVVGSRHHYWRIGHPMWRALEEHGKIGLRYDSSVGFNDEPGYRLGVGYPVQLYSPHAGRTLRTLQIPVMTMDWAMIGPNTRPVPEVEALYSDLLDGLKRHRGVAAVDWHVRTSFPGGAGFDAWGKGYLAVLDILASDPEVEVITPAEVFHRMPTPHDWRASRPHLDEAPSDY